jgi:hypothetical protein
VSPSNFARLNARSIFTPASRFAQRSSYSKFFVSFPFFVVNFTGFKHV